MTLDLGSGPAGPWLRGALAQPAEAPDDARPAAPAKAAEAEPASGRPAKAGKAARPARRPAKAKAPAPTPATPATPAPTSAEVPVDPYASPELGDASKVIVPPRLGLGDVAAMQGLLAVQRLDGWLLQDRAGSNPVALRLLALASRPEKPWVYLLPVSGEPSVVCHDSDAAAFDKVAAKRVIYRSDREREQALRALLKGKKSVALELLGGGPRVAGGGKAVVQVPAELRAVFRALRIAAVSSDHLVQYTSAVWGEPGYLAHHVAAHHLMELRKEALAYVAAQVRAGVTVTDYEVQQRLLRNMTMRGVVGPDPSVASGVNTATPAYQPTSKTATPIRVGDLLLLQLAVKVDRPDGVFAAQTWVAFVGETVPERVSSLFAAVAGARDQAVALMAERNRRRQPLRGHEVDAAARALLGKAHPADRFAHALGHSIDTSLDGAGADLDGFAAKDQRSLVAGTGVTVGPGLYFTGDLGLCSEVTVFLSPSGPQVTTAAQSAVQALLAP
ncbi:MAG: aminopeptidase P family protein [Myxococcales bacterium]|nr:aminopeptidase P family protein [Myxococcales bacterium]